MMKSYAKKKERYFIECTATECKISSKEDCVFLKVKGVDGFLISQKINQVKKDFNVFYPGNIEPRIDCKKNTVQPNAIILDANSFISTGAMEANILQILASSISQGRKIKLEFEDCKNNGGFFTLTGCDITIY